MIIQYLLDWVADVIAPFFLSVAVPAEFGQALTMLSNGAAWLQGALQPFGVLIPFSTISGMLAMLAGAWTFWGVIVLIRVVLWLVGK